MDYLSNIHFTNVWWELLLPLILIGADILTGWIQACINQVVDSTKMRTGLFRKSVEILILGLAFVVSKAVVLPVDIAVFFSIYICIMEVVSIVENADQAGFPIPHWLTRWLKKIQKTMDEGDGDGTVE